MTGCVPASSRRIGRRGLALLALALVGSAIVGGYVDWHWWPVYFGLMLTIAAIALLVGALLLAAIPRAPFRQIGVVGLVIAVGLLIGQNLGPEREPLQPGEGTLTLTLETPVVATATGPVNCSIVASGTDFSMTGDPNLRLETPERPFVAVSFDAGDRWEVFHATQRPRKDGAHFSIGVTSPFVVDGKPSTIGMAATDESTLETTVTATGGTIRFANLAAQTGVDYSGQAMDLSGTLTWTCARLF